MRAERNGIARKVAIIATELGTNLVKHAKDGEILLRTVSRRHTTGLEMIGLDRGPGIKDVNQAFYDGHSTAGTSGTGLGAIVRIASEFDVYSQPSKGTVIVARVSPRRPAT